VLLPAVVLSSVAMPGGGGMHRGPRTCLQLYDNALVAAGLLEDSRLMLGRLHTLMEKLAPAPK
jgi:hypothetical protein